MESSPVYLFAIICNQIHFAIIFRQPLTARNPLHRLRLYGRSVFKFVFHVIDRTRSAWSITDFINNSPLSTLYALTLIAIFAITLHNIIHESICINQSHTNLPPQCRQNLSPTAHVV